MKLCALLLAALIPCLGQNIPADKDKAFGNPAAVTRLDIFSDFSCPTCRAFHMTVLPQLERDYGAGGKLYIVSHEFPLNIPAHKYSREAAKYATAAARIGKYEAVSDKLFQTQADWSVIGAKDEGKVWEMVASVLTPAEQKKVQLLVKDPAMMAEVENDVAEGNKLGVNSTPTVFLTQGMRRFAIPNPMNYELLRSLINGIK
jgi:protein-disulfide isomerase